MKRPEVVRKIDAAFAGTARPENFIRGTCKCDECLEHEQTMKSLNHRDLPLAPLNNPAWDPICFASNHAFSYFMPGLVRLIYTHPGEYMQQFLFHLELPERIASLSKVQARALRDVLDILILEEIDAVEENQAGDDIFRLRETLDQVAEVSD